MIHLTNRQARQFMLLKQGLLGKYKFTGKEGALDYIQQAGCVQFDPVDVCGKNAELTLQSRVKGFKKEQLHELLYEDRKLFDYPDKQLSIIPTEYWPYFGRFREAARKKLAEHPEIEEHIGQFRIFIEENGPVCSDDFQVEGSTSWWSAINWSTGGSLARSVLEQMYSSGDLVVHHKNGTRRYYDLAGRHIPTAILAAADPLPNDFEHLKWRLLRRIGAVGLIWNHTSGAWLNIWNLTTADRNRIFQDLVDEKLISPLTVEGLKTTFYFLTKDMPLLEGTLTGADFEPRCELIAPLDPMMWDKKLIRTIFGFTYLWEIYTPADQRKYGAYVLPLLWGDCFAGRVEAVCDRKSKTLVVKHIWYEDVKPARGLEAAVSSCLRRFALFNDCQSVVM